VATSKDFKHAISVLKKQGLVSDKIDARKAVASQKDRGKRLDTLVKKYDDIVSGKIQAVKVPAKDLRTLRSQGFETASGRVLVPKTKTEVAKFVKGEIQIEAVSGQQRVILPVEYHNLPQYLRELRKNSKLIDRMKRNNEYFGIRYRGGQRANFYGSIELLVDALEQYSFIEKLPKASVQSEIFANLEIMRISPRGATSIEREVETRKNPQSKLYARKHNKKTVAKLKRNPARYARYKDRRAQTEKERRDNMSAREKTAYRAAARKRAKKSRNQAKQKRRK
jgi:hypothetical protein